MWTFTMSQTGQNFGLLTCLRFSSCMCLCHLKLSHRAGRLLGRSEADPEPLSESTVSELCALRLVRWPLWASVFLWTLGLMILTLWLLKGPREDLMEKCLEKSKCQQVGWAAGSLLCPLFCLPWGGLAVGRDKACWLPPGATLQVKGLLSFLKT